MAGDNKRRIYELSEAKREKVINENIKDVANMKSVTDITGNEFQKGEKDLITQVSEYFQKSNNKAQNIELGEITFDRRGIKDDIAHGIGRKKAASFTAVPSVIEKGKVIDYQENWKGRGYDTAVIAAPINIDGKKHYMGIVVMRENNGSRFYVHEVLSIEKGTVPFKTGTVQNGTPGGNAPSIISILQKIANVNTDAEKTSLKYRRNQTKEIDTLLRENVKDYASLSESNKGMVRKLVRDARANGISEADILTYARVSAHSGIEIVFDKEANYNEKSNAYAPGHYDVDTDRIVINPDKQCSTDNLLAHEGFHNMVAHVGGVKKWKALLKIVKKNMSESKRKNIQDNYKKLFGVEDSKVLNEEYVGNFAQSTVNKGFMEFLLAEKPSLKERILGFFKGAITDYKSDEKLSRSARKFYRAYKKMFESFSAQNRNNSASEVIWTRKTDGDARKWMIVTLDNGMQYVEATESQVLSGDNPSVWAQQTAQYINKVIRGGQDFVIKTTDGDFLTITRDTAYKAGTKNQVRNPDGSYRVMTDEEFKVKLDAEIHINELAEVSRENNPTPTPDYKNHKFAKEGFTYRTAYFKDFDGEYYKLTISVGENGGVSTVYNVGKIKKDTLPSGKIVSTFSGSKANNVSSMNSIAENSENVNTETAQTTKKFALDSKNSDLDLIFDEEFYAQYQYESREKITESLAELEKIKASDDFKDLSFDESYEINAKICALKAGYTTLYDYYVGKEKQRLTADYEYSQKTGNPTYASSLVEKKKAKRAKEERLRADIAESTPHKNAQFEIIQQTNPMFNDTSVGIRSPKDIKTFEEAIADSDSFTWGDFSAEDAKRALKAGKVKVFSSYAIKNGVFVSTSYRQALEYAGGEPSGVHSRVVALDSVAWINGDEGQYAKVYGSATTPRYSLPESATQKITAEMSDAERTDILSQKNIKAPIYTGQADISIYANKSKLESEKIGIVAEVIQKLAQDFGVIGEEIKIEDAEVIIKLSKQNLRKSVTADASPMQLAKLMPVLKATVQKSIGIERHDNRYFFDSDTVYFDNLLGGYIEGEDFVPVRFGLKYNHSGNVVLYVVVDQNKIPLSSLTAIKNDRGRQSASLANADSGNSRSVTYSIAQIIKFVNSEDLLRYIPDEMLTEEQKNTKYEAIAKTIKKTNAKNDGRYLEYIRTGNLWEARQMVLAAARAAGYTIHAYHGSNAVFNVFEQSMEGALGEGVYFAESKEYAQGVATNGMLYDVFLRITNPYEAKYPGGISQERLIAQGYDGVHHEGNGFWVAFESSQVKSAETITYDDAGNVIPLSRRFNIFNRDIRFALPESDSTGAELTSEQREYFKESKATDSQGRLLALYHQTDADFTEFDTTREGAGARDNETPNGIFLKPVADDIGLKGKKQMQLYANATNPLRFFNRAEALRYWKQNVEGYAGVIDEIAENDSKYGQAFDEVFDLNAMARKKGVELSRMTAKEQDALFDESVKASEKVLDEWKKANEALDKKAKALIDAYLSENGYDSVFLTEDSGSFGRKIQTFIVLSSEQVKNTDNKAPTKSRDIRWALTEGVDGEDISGYNDSEEMFTAKISEYARFVAKEDRDSFNRSLSNQTRGIAKNSSRTIQINCSKHTYFFEATGYMRGTPLKRIHNRFINIIKKARRNFNVRDDSYTNNADVWSEFVSDIGGHASSNISGIRYGDTASGDDRLFSEKSNGDGAGYTQSSWSDIEEDKGVKQSIDPSNIPSWEELIERIKANLDKHGIKYRKDDSSDDNKRFAVPEGVKVEKTPTAASVTTDKREGYKRSTGEAVRDISLATQVALTNEQAGVEWYLRRSGLTEQAQIAAQFTRASGAMGNTAATVAQWDLSKFDKAIEVRREEVTEISVAFLH